jgi:Protein of unknown function (DUF1036)
LLGNPIRFPWALLASGGRLAQSFCFDNHHIRGRAVMRFASMAALQGAVVFSMLGFQVSEAAAAEGSLSFCNRQKSRISVVIVHYLPNTDKWFMSRWQSANPGQCTSFKLESTETVVYHARTANGSLTWPGASSFDREWCVGPSKLNRNVPGNRNCAPDDKHLPFRIVKPDAASFRVNLD